MRVRLEGRQIKVFGVSGLDGRSMNGTWLNWIERGEMDSGESSGTEYLNRRLVFMSENTGSQRWRWSSNNIWLKAIHAKCGSLITTKNVKIDITKKGNRTKLFWIRTLLLIFYQRLFLPLNEPSHATTSSRMPMDLGVIRVYQVRVKTYKTIHLTAHQCLPSSMYSGSSDIHKYNNSAAFKACVCPTPSTVESPTNAVVYRLQPIATDREV